MPRAGRPTPGEIAGPAPQSQPVCPRSSPRSAFAQSVAFGLGLRMLAAGPAHFPTLLRSRRLCERPANSARELNKPHEARHRHRLDNRHQDNPPLPSRGRPRDIRAECRNGLIGEGDGCPSRRRSRATADSGASPAHRQLEARRVVGRRTPSLIGVTSLLLRVRGYGQSVGAGSIDAPALVPRQVSERNPAGTRISPQAGRGDRHGAFGTCRGVA